MIIAFVRRDPQDPAIFSQFFPFLTAQVPVVELGACVKAEIILILVIDLLCSKFVKVVTLEIEFYVIGSAVAFFFPLPDTIVKSVGYWSTLKASLVIRGQKVLLIVGLTHEEILVGLTRVLKHPPILTNI